MKTSTILPVKEGDILGVLRGFLGSLLENQIVDALLVPLEIGQGRSLAQTLVQDPVYLSGANPLSPVMPVNSATLVSQLTGDRPSQKVGVVLRSCEIRALIELVKLQQANLDNLTIIGVDCLGTYEVDDYARLIGRRSRRRWWLGCPRRTGGWRSTRWSWPPIPRAWKGLSGRRTVSWPHISKCGVLPYGPGRTSPARTPSR